MSKDSKWVKTYTLNDDKENARQNRLTESRIVGEQKIEKDTYKTFSKEEAIKGVNPLAKSPEQRKKEGEAKKVAALNKAAVKIQTAVRGHQAKGELVNLKSNNKAAVTIQTAVRGHQAKGELVNLKREEELAKEAARIAAKPVNKALEALRNQKPTDKVVDSPSTETKPASKWKTVKTTGYIR